jgi:hypothetical protein
MENQIGTSGNMPPFQEFHKYWTFSADIWAQNYSMPAVREYIVDTM